MSHESTQILCACGATLSGGLQAHLRGQYHKDHMWLREQIDPWERISDSTAEFLIENGVGEHIKRLRAEVGSKATAYYAPHWLASCARYAVNLILTCTERLSRDRALADRNEIERDERAALATIISSAADMMSETDA